ncbi:MAG TPA: hypothetical protein VGH72_33795 [Pseudonocardia sp.]|jgi:uncharacterized membrane protein
MSTFTLSLLGDLGALLVALGLLIATFLAARRVEPRNPAVTAWWILVGACAGLALVFAAIVLGQLLASS